MSLAFLANIQVHSIDDHFHVQDDNLDDNDANVGPLEHASPSASSSIGNDGISKGIKRKLSPESNLNENESNSLHYFTRPSLDNLKAFLEFHRKPAIKCSI